mgnify:CR=1 FL=1
MSIVAIQTQTMIMLAKNPNHPLATLDAAIGKCTASNGDHILVSEGHSETYSTAAALTLDVAGVTIVGLGRGNQRPTFTLDTATTSDIDVTAADVAIKNCIFSANYADIVELFDLSAAGFTLIDCVIRDTAASMNFVDVIKTTTTNNECDRLTIVRCKYFSPDTGNDAFIEVGGDLDELTIVDSYIRMGVANSEAVIAVATGKDLTNCYVVNNSIYRINTAGDILVDSDTSNNTGIFAFNLIGHGDTASEALIDADGVRVFENLGTAVDTAQGYLVPAIDS